MKTQTTLGVFLLLIVVAAAWLGWTSYSAATQARLALADLRQLQAMAENPVLTKKKSATVLKNRWKWPPSKEKN